MNSPPNSRLFTHPVAAALLMAGVGGVVYVVVAWLNKPAIPHYHFEEYIALGCALNFVSLSLTPAVAKRSLSIGLIGICFGILLYYVTRWGWEEITAEPTRAKLLLAGALIETGILIGIWFAIAFQTYRVVVRCAMAGMVAGIVLLLAHLPLLAVYTTEYRSFDEMIRNITLWSMALAVTMPAFTVFPCLVIHRELRILATSVS